MSENGKGDKQRPLSVGQEIFTSNWERTFKSNELTEVYTVAPDEYIQTIQSGMFWELYPELTGTWELDAAAWRNQNVHR